MPTGNYQLSNGKLVKGTTTIIGRFKNANALIHWAWTCGRDGKDYRQERDKAGEQGTSVHDCAEKYILGIDFELPEDKKVQKAFNKFKEWWDKDENGNYILIDFKTGKQIYNDTIIQLGAYSWLISENDNIQVNKGIIVRLPKNNSKIEIKEFIREQLIFGWEQFTLYLQAYDNDAIIDRYFRKEK
jgi:hypothetical protein